MSYKPEVNTAGDREGVFTGNALRFETKAAAQNYVVDLMMRWTAVRETRVVDSDDPVSDSPTVRQYEADVREMLERL